MNSDLINALIAAGTSLAVVVLSQFLIHIKDRSQLREKEMDAVLKEYFNPIRFMLSENYFRISQIVSEVKREGNAKELLTVNRSSEIAGKDDEWFSREGCYLVSSGYLLACMFSYIDNIRTKLSFFRLPHNKDTELIRLINKLTAEFSRGGIYYVIQMDTGKKISSAETGVLSYREFCMLLKNEQDLVWYSSIIDFFLGLGRGRYREAEYILKDIEELTHYIDHAVSGGDSIEQKMQAEREHAPESEGRYNSSVSSPADLA